jgi:hypothetical protein
MGCRGNSIFVHAIDLSSCHRAFLVCRIQSDATLHTSRLRSCQWPDEPGFRNRCVPHLICPTRAQAWRSPVPWNHDLTLDLRADLEFNAARYDRRRVDMARGPARCSLRRSPRSRRVRFRRAPDQSRIYGRQRRRAPSRGRRNRRVEIACTARVPHRVNRARSAGAAFWRANVP